MWRRSEWPSRNGKIAYEQLRDLAALAEREGMYDAADWIREQLNGR